MRVGKYKLHTKRHLVGMSLIGGMVYFTVCPTQLRDAVYSGLRYSYARIESLTEESNNKENLSILERLANENSN